LGFIRNTCFEVEKWQIANLKDLQIKVIKFLGAEYEKYYF